VMKIVLSATGSPAYFVVLNAGDDISGAVSDWVGDLPVTGDYHVRVFLSDQDASAGGHVSWSMAIEIR